MTRSINELPSDLYDAFKVIQEAKLNPRVVNDSSTRFASICPFHNGKGFAMWGDLDGIQGCSCKACGVLDPDIAIATARMIGLPDVVPESIADNPADNATVTAQEAIADTLTPDVPESLPDEKEPEIAASVASDEPAVNPEPTATPPCEPVKPEPVKSEPTQPKFQFKPISEVVKQHPGLRTWWLRGYIPAASVVLIYGDPACGKTTIAVDIDCAIATQSIWRDVRAKQGKILYVAAEDYYGARLRIEAWFERNGLQPDNIDILDIPIVLAEESDVDMLISIINSMPIKPASITIDTLALSMGKYSENNDMQLFCNGATKIKSQTGVTVIIIHHCGHGDKGRSRGGSQLPANADVIYQVERKDDVCTMKCQKMKNGIEPADLSWNMQTQSTQWADEDGLPINSVVMVPVDNPEPEDKPKKPSRQQEVALSILRDLVREHEANLSACGIDPAGARVLMSEWKAAVVKVITAKSSRSDAIDALIGKGLVVADGLFVRLGS